MGNFGFLLLGVDSLIACVAVGAVLGKKAWVPFAASFGIADAGGLLIGSAFHWSMPEGTASVVATVVLVALGVYWIVLALATQEFKGTNWVWLLPPVLAVDNITFGVIDHSWTTSLWGEAAEQLVSSAVMGGIGIATSIALVRGLPALWRRFARPAASPAVMGDGGGGAVATRISTGALAGLIGGTAVIVLAPALMFLDFA